MSTPTLPVEGAWSGGLTSDGFSVKVRSDQVGNFTLDVSERSDFGVLIPTTPVALGQDAFFCGQVDVGGLNPATAGPQSPAGGPPTARNPTHNEYNREKY